MRCLFTETPPPVPPPLASLERVATSRDRLDRILSVHRFGKIVIIFEPPPYLPHNTVDFGGGRVGVVKFPEAAIARAKIQPTGVL